MSKGINRVLIVGNVGNIDVKTKDAFKVANISIATSEFWKDREGNVNTKTEWHRCVCFGKLADIADSFVKKGNKLCIEGKLQTRKWQDKDGRDMYTTEVVITDLILLGSKPDETPQIHKSEQVESENPYPDIPF